VSRVVIVTGSRDWEYPKDVYEALKEFNPDLVVQGGCKTGADKFARDWCDKNNKTYRSVYADWEKFGRCAGPRRNKEMLEYYPSATVLSFCRDNSKGTTGTIKLAKQLGMKVVEKSYEIL
jgi:hypothetical protein